MSLHAPSLPQQFYRFPRAARKPQRVSQGRAFHEFIRPLIVARKSGPDRQVRPVIQQQSHQRQAASPN